ncbi:hypothetical protein WEN_02455 [Mycoplasma wenyonii str. Massachusetts]|uniref:Uncharacterized protein n=1 Tax=Mycoplasma wenyonii (strain Massachusetts) TaxID=1197325 RepID=I6Z6S8_MYCWM|nr:hypothetical protein [Mycoplasma wenyonii]AFN65278.1 hypothetical protein WEN_02455 [Mycoplasma wenyonii str. Massachusetts]
MSFAIGLLGKALVVGTAGVGIMVPVARALRPAVERVKLEKQEDLKNLCLIVLQGDGQETQEAQQAKHNKKLLACQRDNNPETTEFFFYDSSKSFNVSNLKTVRHLETTSGSTEVSLVFEGSEEVEQKETIKNIQKQTWTPLHGINLKEQTKINLKEKKIYFTDNWIERDLPLTTWSDSETGPSS